MSQFQTAAGTAHDPRADVLVLENAPYDGPYAIGTALEAAGLTLRTCRVWAGDPVPDTLDGTAALVVLGGATAVCLGHEDFPGRAAELALLRAALAAEVPVLGVCLGARLLAVAAGAEGHRGGGAETGWGAVDLSPVARRDPLFTDVPGRLRVFHGHTDSMELPHGATPLASCDRDPVQAFRIGGSAWGLRFHLEVDKSAVDALAAAFPDEAPDIAASASAELAALAPYRDGVFARFAALVAERAATTMTRTFFTPRAATWEQRFADDNPVYAAAVSAMGLRRGQRALDVGCGSGRALPALRAEVGEEGVVLGADLTPAMLTAAVSEGRAGLAGLLVADACRLPLPSGTMDGIFSAGLINHVPDPPTALREWARVTAPGGVLLLFHPSGRAERAARHGRPLDPDDPLAEDNLRPALHAAGWDLVRYEDAAHHFLARAVRLTTEPGT
ncbi:methyltransferase domain-containing protein [Streptomyces sp. YIM S03343]